MAVTQNGNKVKILYFKDVVVVQLQDSDRYYELGEYRYGYEYYEYYEY